MHHRRLASVMAFLLLISSCSTTTAPTVVKQGVLGAPVNVVDLGSVVVGQSTSNVTYIRNTGNDAVTITSLSVTTAPVFGVTILAGFPLNIAPGDSARIQIAFHPDDVGPQTATVQLSVKNAKDSVTTFQVKGNGTAYRIHALNMYIYDEAQYDVNEALTGIVSTTEVVVDTNATKSGKSGCIHTQSDANIDSYFKYESNGDISYFFPSVGYISFCDSGWVTFPFGTKALGAVRTRAGTGIAVNGSNSAPMTFVDSIRYIGPDTLTLNGELLRLQHGQLFQQYVILGNVIPATVDMYYSPRLGFFARQEFKVTLPAAFSNLSALPPHRNRLITSDSLR